MNASDIAVVTFFSPRPKHPKMTDYLGLLQWQKKTVARAGHRHVLVSDHAFKGEDVFTIPMLPHSLMKAILTAQIAYLETGWDGSHPVVLVDIDCLIARSLVPAFDGGFDLGITSRPHDRCRVNNGAMYVGPGNKAAVVDFFNLALAVCGDHWGGDQEAIAQVAEPIPKGHGAMQTEVRDHGLRLRFLPMLVYNVASEMEDVRHVNGNPFVVHFKGVRSKAWMPSYARKFILKGGV